MFLSILKKIGSVVAGVAASMVVLFLILLMGMAVNNKTGDADSFGWGVILMPLVMGAVLAATIPLTIKASYHFIENSIPEWKVLGTTLTIIVIIALYLCLFISYCYANASIGDTMTLLPAIVMFISGTVLIGFIIYGLVGGTYAVLILPITALILYFVVITPMQKNINEMKKAKTVVRVSYGEEFDMKSFQQYEFPDFILKPDIQGGLYVIIEKEGSQAKGMLNRNNYLKYYKDATSTELTKESFNGKYFMVHQREKDGITTIDEKQ